MTSLLVIVVAAAIALVVLVLAFKLVWRVAEPNEALIISGLGAHGDSSADMPGDTGRGFKIVVGRGTAVIPGFQTVRRFYLGLRTTTLTVKAPSNQSIPLTVKGVVVFKVADDKSSIANAARRFLEQTEDVLVGTIHELFAGHLRAIVGGLSVEDMLHNRESLTSAIRSSLADDLGKLGLIVDSLQIQEIDDEVGYINNLGKPQAAAIEAAARIAAAQRDQEATQAEQVADARKAEAVRQSQIEQAAYQADVDKAKAESAQAGPLMQAQARQEVVRAETAAAELDAQRQEKVLNTEVRKPADAEAYRQVTIANAERDAAIARAQAQAQQTTLTGNAEAEATKATGDAEAEVIKAKGLAEAAGIKARADALAENQDAVIAQIIAERYPEIVAAGAQAMANVDNMVVLNGGDGVEDLLAKAMTMGGAGLGIAQNLIASITANSKETSPSDS
jgi:flotillin